MGVRYLRHPDLARTQIRERVEARALGLVGERRGWKHNLGFVLVLFRTTNGERTGPRFAGTYADAVLMRESEMSSGLYEKAWIMESTGRSGRE